MHLLRQVPIILLAVLGAIPAAADHVLTLGDGKVLTIPTRLGAPVHASNEYIEVQDIFPRFDRDASWRSVRLFWAFEYSFKAEFEGDFSVVMPGRDVPRNMFRTKDGPDIRLARNAFFFRRAELLERGDHPGAWSWLEEPGDSWIPFQVILRDAKKDRTLTFDDCARVTETTKKSLRQDLERIKTLEADFQTHQQVLPDGTHLTYRTMGGLPLRHATHNLQIDVLAPTALLDSVTGMPRSQYWVLQGRYRGGNPFKISVTAPWLNKAFKHVVKVSGNGVFSVRFAPRDANPEFWSWLENPEEALVALRICIEEENAPSVDEFVEVTPITPTIREEFRKLFVRAK